MTKIHIKDCCDKEIQRYKGGISQFMMAIILILDNNRLKGDLELPPIPIIIHKPTNC